MTNTKTKEVTPTTQMSNARMIWHFLKVRKKWWLIPIVLFTLIISLILVSTSHTAYAPFVYTLF